MSLHIKNYHGAGVLLFRYNKEKETFEVLLGKRSLQPDTSEPSSEAQLGNLTKGTKTSNLQLSA